MADFRSSFSKSFRGEKLVEQERSTKREFLHYYIAGAENKQILQIMK